ncbi:MAG: type IX secretion system membrane protein PorP/SprF [Dysgonamonadaceae bacterium]|jgi:type IX secretion system PorP/SprF family membrane protein|nr:type IX secretion system membrane protein PorP/SprF [Dysgonamonadaceae bacterium]
MKKYFLPAVIFFACPSLLKAQLDTQLSNYWATVGYYNPAYAGQSEKLNVTLMSRMQWLGISNAPRTTIVTADMSCQFLGRTHGVGFLMYNDRIGLFSTSATYGQYAWKTKLFKGNFSLGLQGGSVSQSFDGTKGDIPEDDYHTPLGSDPAIPTVDVSGKGTDASLGLFYDKGKWFAGLSVNHLLSPKIDLDDKYVYEIPRTYYFVGGYNMQLSNPLLELQPTVFLKTMEMSSLHFTPDSLQEQIESNTLKAMLRNSQASFSLRLIYDKKFWGGLSWRYGDAVVLMLGGKFKTIEAGYAYDFPVSRIIKVSTGSHEVFLKYPMDLNLKKQRKSKHKSIRIL